jgi:hypothetical protein
VSWAAVIAGGAAIAGGVISSQGAKKAAGTAAAGSDAASAEAARQFDTIRGDNLGRINIGNQAANALGAIYGYSPNVGSPYQTNPATYGATPLQAPNIAPSGFGNTGTSSYLNPATVSSKLGGAGKILDPAFGLFGNLFGGGHGDEKRNLQAFAAESGAVQLPNGQIMLPDGSTFSQDQLQNVAGTWYGAVHAPDGNQQDWQNKYTTLLGGLQKTQLPGAGNAGGGLTSDGVPNSAPFGTGAPGAAGTNPLAASDYSAFFKSPDYQFRKDQGMQGIQNSFAASGGAKSGNALKALADFNSNLAAGEFGNYFNRQAAIAGIGQTATGQSGNAGIATGQIVGNALQNSADARASGVAGQYNALGQGLSGLSQGLGYYMQQRQNPYGYDPSGIGYFSPTQRRVGG